MVYITSRAPAGGLTINLTVTNPATGVTIPATVTIPAGLLYGSFVLSTSAAMTPGTVNVTATLNGNSLPAQFDVTN